MGVGNKLIVSATGFPGTNKTLRFIQDAFREPLGALAQLAGDKTIITGVIVDNTDPLNVIVSNGFITYKGEIIPFQGGNFVNTVTIIEAFENVSYNTDANNDTVLDSLPAYRTIYAKCGTGGNDIFNFSDLTALKTVKELSSFTLPNGIVIDANYLAFTQAMLDKLNAIEDNAQVNVQADWNVDNPASDAYIKNKPIRLLNYLYKGSNWIGDIISDDQLKTIYFPSVGTSNYIAVCSVVSGQVAGTDNGGYYTGWNRDDDISYVVVNKTATSFQLGFREYAPNTQNLTVDFILIPN